MKKMPKTGLKKPKMDKAAILAIKLPAVGKAKPSKSSKKSKKY